VVHRARAIAQGYGGRGRAGLAAGRRRALRAARLRGGLIGFACTNFNALVAPPGGRTPVLGTNPLAYALPAERHAPVVFDVATTDPAAFFAGGSLAPLGSPHAPHKGFGLSLVIDALSGVLTGSGFGQGVAAGAPGNLLWALDVEGLIPREEFLARMDALIDQVQQGERAPGVAELVVPGERGERRHHELSERGVVPLEPASWQTLAAGCETLGVPLPSLVDAP
jgi:LDH2 family malate/lactate/ureidoglycolate dehydrogenase